MTARSGQWPADAVEVATGVHVAVTRLARARPDPRDTGEPTAPLWRVRERAAARALLRELVAAVAGGDTGGVATRGSGQPFLPARPELRVSLSHSGDWVAAAVGVGDPVAGGGIDVGVDVQTPEPVPARLVRRCCRPDARAVVAGLPPARRDLAFAWIWTVQEACVKATGAGLAGRPWTIPVDVGQPAGVWGDVSWRSLHGHASVPLSCAYRVVSR